VRGLSCKSDVAKLSDGASFMAHTFANISIAGLCTQYYKNARAPPFVGALSIRAESVLDLLEIR
jgi:hypothetical protein